MKKNMQTESYVVAERVSENTNNKNRKKGVKWAIIILGILLLNALSKPVISCANEQSAEADTKVEETVSLEEAEDNLQETIEQIELLYKTK